LHALLEQAQPQADPPRGQGVEIMTIHRAKGLEFDTVVLLGVGREPRPDEPRALHWLERTAADGRDDLLIAPLAIADDERLIKFVRRNERQRDLAERGRLLYVAATRARARLHVIAQLPSGRPQPRQGSLLAHLWPVVAGQFAAAETAAMDGDASNEPAQPAPPRVVVPALERLEKVLEPAAPPLALTPPPSALSAQRPEFSWAGRSAAHVGTVVHQVLRTIAAGGVERWSASALHALVPSFRRELALLGVDAAELDAAAERVSTALTRVLDDPHGRFVLGAHGEAQSELRVTLKTPAGLEHVRLDRTFVADGRRWIVDFKTSSHEGGDAEAFLASEVERYRSQLERYARAMALIDERPIEAALYFPLLRALRSWPARAAGRL
jgi:ATP-dependent exoDNAse (exonuclease V) beta subunit